MLKRRKKMYWILASAITLIGLAAVAAGPVLSRVEQPKYEVERSIGAIEIRSYGPMIAAQATVEGEREKAINKGFRIIAAYIFGANKPNAEIAMTAPVQQQREQTISMTAPVTQQSDGESWTVQFIMPNSWTMATLPVPDDKRVKLIPLPARQAVVIQFSGSANDELIAERTAELRRFVSKNDLTIVGDPLYAFYNPPWTLPFLRRNEVMLELAPS